MKTTGKSERIKWTYFEKVKIPVQLKPYIWDSEDKVYLEKLIYRTLIYGSFNDLKLIFKLYPEETYEIAFKYPDIHRGVRYWIKKWKKNLI
jgi:hypothetical protein